MNNMKNNGGKMVVEITSRHENLSQDMRDYIESEIERISKVYDRIVDIHVILDKQAHSQYGVEIIINVPNKQLVIKQEEDEQTKAIDEAVEKMVRQMKKYKEKLRQ
ncbi:MAG: ribosome-associated translation inhibitor RaiA [Candidatus Marinimicrobia bacterium]|nr:ribosome-associated translation inhibitor RaiA [Candidatus Neomarinimicrobiota bacterium]